MENKVKQKIKKLKNLDKKISEILDEYDPVKLDAPKGEYSMEASEITRKLKNCKDAKSINKMIYGVFLEHFENGIGNESEYMKISKKIYNLINTEFKGLFE